MTQTSFAKILGFGDKTIARYENGSIQDTAQNNLMDLSDYPDVFELLLKKSMNLISTSDYEKAVEALEKYSSYYGSFFKVCNRFINNHS